MAHWQMSTMNIYFSQIIVGIFIFNSLGCGHSPIRDDRPTASSGVTYDQTDQQQSFGFFEKDDEYYFAEVEVRKNGNLCRFFVGYKNGDLEYSFPSDRLKDLSKVYFKNLSVEEKKSRTLKAVAKFEKEKRICTPEIAKRQMTVAEMMESGIYLTFFLPIALISAVTFGAEVTVNAIKDEFLKSRMKDIRLGMSQSELENLLKRPLTKVKLKKYDYYFVDGQHTRLALYFEDNQLNAFVRGYKYKTQHEGQADK